MCREQKVKWRGQGTRFVDIRGRSYKLWWSGNNDGIVGVKNSVKEALCEKVVEVQRKSGKLMAMVLVF